MYKRRPRRFSFRSEATRAPLLLFFTPPAGKANPTPAEVNAERTERFYLSARLCSV